MNGKVWNFAVYGIPMDEEAEDKISFVINLFKLHQKIII